MTSHRIALTFDDGPDVWTEPILDLLAEHSAKATFFVIGSAVSERAHLIRRMHADGHEVGNHTWSHPRLTRDCDDAEVRDELQRTNEVLTELAGHAPRRFRAPHYDADERVLGIAAELGLAHTGVDLTPPDWDERFSASYLTTFVAQQAQADAIVGFHDGVPPSERKAGRSRQPAVDAIALILPRLAERGFECVTVSDLL